MALISQVVRKALSSGCLTVEAEAMLSQQFEGGCSLEDITALSLLQRAVRAGMVTRLSQDWDHTRSAAYCELPMREQASGIKELQFIP